MNYNIENKKATLKEVEHHWHLELGKVQENGVILETTFVHPKELFDKLRQPMIYSSLQTWEPLMTPITKCLNWKQNM
jgi:hypothetical protein